MSAVEKYNSKPRVDETLSRKKWLKCDPKRPASEVARQALKGRLSRVPQLLGRVVEHGMAVPDEVRKLRVATRRASTAVITFAEFSTPAMATQVARDLKKIRKAAGRIRDLDVLIENTRARDPRNRSLPGLRLRRFVAQAKIEKSYFKYIESGRYHSDSQLLLASLPTTRDDDPTHQFAHWARNNLASSGSAFFASWPSTSATSEENFAALHNLRLLVKKLRYELELLGAITPKKLKKKFHRKLKLLQNSLGEVNDHDVAMHSIHRWLRKSKDEKRTALLAQLESEYAARTVAVDTFNQRWDAESLSKLKRTFDRMMSEASAGEEKPTA